MWGTGNDLTSGSFVTLNGKAWRESHLRQQSRSKEISDFLPQFAEHVLQ